MKRILVLIVTCIMSISIYYVYANTTELSTKTQTEDCIRVGNVEVNISYSYHSKGVDAKVNATNYNKYRVTIRYKLYASNGTRNYPIDSGVLSIAAATDERCGGSDGPWVRVPEGFSCYLEVENPEYCD